jgi:serine/threonine protein kinase
MAMSVEEDFPGTERFSIRRRLGAGAFGVVYEAFDRESESVVALKTLRPGNVDSLYRLKREFRALADIAHPNLAALYELLTDEEHWFFTMELVEGVNFLQHVRARTESPSPVSAGGLGSTVSEPSTASIAHPTGAPAVPSCLPFDAGRLRDGLRQVVSGVASLHEAGKLHRDIKPSNVLVTPEGRVVLLDFGLVTELGPFGDDRSLSLVGTPAYISPEQGSRIPVSEKSDWYSLGVMLYEALTDRQPFRGSFVEMMLAKSRAEPEAPRALLPQVPEDLDALCLDLLRRDPKARPTAEQILIRLGGSSPIAVRLSETSPMSLRPGPFVGRRSQLSAMRDAFEASRQGKAVSLYVHGTSGIGKSALVRRFLEQLRSENVVVLAGRCYERESMPYKALDSLVDSLSQYLKRLPVEQSEALLPTDVLALARVFPVLRRVEAVAGTRRRTIEIADSFELRRRAFAALRELLARLAARHDVVLFIDDLQWGDADSAALLEDLMRPPDSPALLVIACYRSEEAATSPLLKRLLARPEAADVRSVAVAELEPSEARELALALAEADAAISPSQAESIAREAGGNPFFINELARFGRPGAAATLDELVRARVRDLPPEARRLLEVVAVAGRPLEAEVADSAAGGAEGIDALPVLRAGHLVRARGTADRPEIETYHDRIREAVVAQIPPEILKEHHRRLAVALEASGRADPEELSMHFQEAGDAERAAEFAVTAAERAVQALAFDRAARHFRTALELGSNRDAQSRRALTVKMGDALLNAGRGAEAARTYLEAARVAAPAEAMDLEGRAAAQLVRSGRLDEALPLYEALTGRLGLTLLQPSWRTRLQYLVERALIGLRGVGFRERDASQIPAERLLRLDTFYTLFTGLSLVNTFRAREFQSRHFLLALRAGEPYRVALAVAWESGFAGVTGGWRKRDRSDRLFRKALELGERIQRPDAVAISHMCRCAGAVFLGEWRTCWERGQAAEEIYRERCTGVAWELLFSQFVALRGLFYLGGLRELSLRLPGLIREARARDDLTAVASFGIRGSYLAYLTSDEPETAQENLQRIVGAFSRRAFTNPTYWAMIAGGEIALYARRPSEGREPLLSQWPAFKRSGLERLQFYRIEALHLRGRTALACAAQASSAAARTALLRSAAQDARLLEREATPWGAPLARLIRAGIAAARQEAQTALRLLSRSEEELASLDMALYAAAARRQRGLLLGGNEGRELVEAADAWMAGEDIKNPERMADMLAPGSWS